MSEDASELVELRGHVIDSGMLGQVLNEILERGGDYEIARIDVGKHHEDPTYVALRVSGSGPDELQALLERLQTYGANPALDGDARFEQVTRDGVLPEGFHSTTNLPTRIRVDGTWIEVENPEMDCGILYDPTTGRARTIPMDDVRVGMLLVVGLAGVKVSPRDKPRANGPAPVGREDEGGLLRGPRLSGVAHPAPPKTRSQRQASRLHLPVEEVADFRDIQGAVAHPPPTSIERSPTCSSRSTASCGDAATTSATACRRGPSATSTTSRGGGSSGGCANVTPG